MEANKIQVIDDQGNEKEFEVLFTFNNEELGKQYVLYYDTTVEEPSVFEMVEEVCQSFMAESEEGHECCGNHGNGCCHDNDEEHECCGNHGDCNCDN